MHHLVLGWARDTMNYRLSLWICDTHAFNTVHPISQLTNIKDCLARGFIKEGETPLEVAAQQLIKDGINGEYLTVFTHLE